MPHFNYEQAENQSYSKMKKCLLTKIVVANLTLSVWHFATIGYALASEGNSDLFKTKLSNYIDLAKKFSQKKMEKEEIDRLASEAVSILDDLKNRYINEKLKIQNIKLKYLNGKDFPVLEEHQNNNVTDHKIVLFTIACHALFKILFEGDTNSAISKNTIFKIVEKSPLEMVSIIKELSVFMQFISANPNDFGHGVFSEKQGNSLVVFATNDAILRIMKVLIYKNLLQNNKIYKVSRLGTKIIEDISNNINEEIINSIIESLKRNTADDKRIAIEIPDAMLNLTTTDLETNEFKMTANNYIEEINLFRRAKDNADRQIHMNKALEFAKTLLGIIPNIKINVSEKVFEFCKVLEKKCDELKNATESNDKKIALKAKRDVTNCLYIENFLKCTAVLLDSLYADPQILYLIVEKMADFVPNIGCEITVLLRVLEFITSAGDSTEIVIAKLREFAKSSEDGNYLLSPLLSVAMEKVSTLDYKHILTSNDFSNGEICKYLKIR